MAVFKIKNHKVRVWRERGRWSLAVDGVVSGDWFMSEAQAVRVPAHADHRFRSKPITHSGGSRSPIPEQADR